MENTQNKVDNEGEKIYYDNQWYRLKDNLETVLIMGEDKFEAGEDDADYVNTRQTDFLLLLILDKTNRSSQILQLNRDTMTDIESYVWPASPPVPLPASWLWHILTAPAARTAAAIQ